MLLTIKEVAKRLQISLSMVYALVAKGDLACYEIGTCKRISETDLGLFLEQRKKEPAKRIERKRRHF
jgi:excisionase family DNA binding protein